MKILNVLFLSALIGLASCSKETITPPDPTKPVDKTPTTEYYFHADINGSYTLIEDTKNDYLVKNGSQDDGNLKRTFSTLANSNDNNSLELMMIGDVGSANPTAVDVYNLFQVGTVAFSNRTKKGIVVNWKDESGKTWTTDTRFGGQSSSTFVIESVGSFIENKKTFKVVGTFKCRAYDLAGDFKSIENAKFSVTFDASK